jgi:Carboxypeptidase regulatory-like domain
LPPSLKLPQDRRFAERAKGHMGANTMARCLDRTVIGSLACVSLGVAAQAHAGTISGRVTATSGVAIIGIEVQFYDSMGALVARANANASGDYVLTVPAGSYYVRTAGLTELSPKYYMDEVYDTSGSFPCTPCGLPPGPYQIYNDSRCTPCDATCGTAIAVSATQAVTNIDFTLSPVAPPATTGTTAPTAPSLGAPAGRESRPPESGTVAPPNRTRRP